MFKSRIDVINRDHIAQDIGLALTIYFESSRHPLHSSHPLKNQSMTCMTRMYDIDRRRDHYGFAWKAQNDCSPILFLYH